MQDLVEKFSQYNQSERQQEMLSIIANLRGYSNNSIFNYAKAVQMFEYADVDNLLKGLPIYENCFHSQTGESLVYGKLFVPGFSPTKELLTYICYDIINQTEAKISGVKAPAYFYPQSTYGMKRGSYLYAPPDAWDSIVSSDDLYIVDGVWDSAALNLAGVPTVALLSSSLTDAMKQILRIFKRLYLVMDNDSAGSRLYQEMMQIFGRVYRVVIPPDVGKDADDYIKRTSGDYFASQLRPGQNIYLKGAKTNGGYI